MGVPQDSFTLGDISNESLCMISIGGQWSVFYSERGERIEEEKYTDESDACHGFMKRISRMLGISEGAKLEY